MFAGSTDSVRIDHRIDRRTSAFRLVVAAVLALAMMATACGGSDASTTEESSAADIATEVPADPTEPPAEPTDVPAEPTEVPTEVPEEPTAVPEEPTEVPAEPAYQPIAADDPALVDAGMAVYTASCSGCHGADGAGSDRGRPLTGIAVQQPDRLIHFASVSNGKGNMPAFAANLSGEDIDAALSYVRLTFLPAEQEEEAGEEAGAPVEDASAMIAAGMAVFAENCAGCHGMSGEGTSRGRPLMEISAEQPDQSVHITVVVDGKGRMPAFGDKLSADEIAAVVAYVHEL